MSENQRKLRECKDENARLRKALEEIMDGRYGRADTWYTIIADNALKETT